MNWHGKGKTIQNPWTGIALRDEIYIDRYGREYRVQAGSQMRHFETSNFGWVVWRAPNGQVHINDVG